uniref:Reverse transcriptase domain-containing protein n=1 Tax=Strigamia maritima TaxID=126957 RepID=T1IZD7_STRMM
MINSLEGYVADSRLIVNVGGKPGKSEKWWLGGDVIEVVKKFKYLGYTFTPKNSPMAHLRDRTAKAQKIVRCVWGIIKRSGMSQFSKMKQLFESLMSSMAGYGVELWGLKEQIIVERVQNRFFKIIADLDINTPNYIWRLEMGRPRMQMRTIKSVFKYILGVMQMPEERWLRHCLDALCAGDCGGKWWTDLQSVMGRSGSMEALPLLKARGSVEQVD